MPIAPRTFSIGPKTERTPWQNESVRKVVGRALQRERKALFRKDPLCRECTKAGRVTIATIRDHIIPLSQGGQDVRSNTQPLCKECHDLKSRDESVKGSKMARDTRGV